MEKQKIFVGSGKEIGQYGNIAISFALEDVKQYAKEAPNGKHYINLVVGKKKEKDQYGKTHYLSVNEYNPETKEERSAKQATENALNEEYGEPIISEEKDDIPVVEDDQEINLDEIPF
jgi:hypothetical protein